MARILLIDKDVFLESICRNFFHESGHTFDSIPSMSNALTQLAHLPPPDLVLLSLDWGFNSVASLWDQLRQFPQTKIIYISSNKNPSPELLSFLTEPQVQALLIRPFPLYKLTEVIDRLFPTEESEPALNQAPPPIEAWIGVNLGGCQIESCLSTGHFSLVYKGIYQDQTAVVKILSNLGMQPKERMVRFQREVDVLYQFKHPYIIEVLATGVEKDVYYMIMPYFPGESLDKILQQEARLPVIEASCIIYQVAQGMAAIHTKNVIHRDLKPANILYNRADHHSKVIDFGLARETGGNQAITRKGYILGTPYYMSPEQCEGRILDARADIYSLGISFYHLLTGLVPFDKSSPVKTLLAHIRDPLIWPPDAQTNIPTTIRSMIERMTAKKPDGRYPNMKEVANELNNIQQTLGWNFAQWEKTIPPSE